MNTKTLLISAAIAMSFSATPAMAQFGSGTSYDKPRTTQTSKKAAKKKAEQLRKLEEARMKKEAMERELQEKEQMAQSYGSGTDEDAMKKKDDAMQKEDAMKSYGSGTTEDAMQKKDEMKSYGSGDGMMKKDEMKSYGSSMGKPANCPSGTTPQTDGTCLLTSGSLPIN